jgi:hypothetical protein
MLKLKDLLKEWTDTSFRDLPKRWSKPVMKGHEPDGLTEFERLGGKDIVKERIPELPRINMGFGEAQSYAKMMVKKSNDIIKSTRSGNMGKAKKITKDMEEIVTQIKRVLGI